MNIDIHDLEALSNAPEQYLSTHSVQFKTHVPVILIILLLTIVPLAAWLMLGSFKAPLIVFGVMLILAMAIILKPVELLLFTIHGPEFICRNKKIKAPWSLFRTKGSPVIDEGQEIIFPVNRDVIPQVQLLVNDSIVASGENAKSKQFGHTISGDIKIRSVYDISTEDLAHLFKTIAMHLGSVDELEGRKL